MELCLQRCTLLLLIDHQPTPLCAVQHLFLLTALRPFLDLGTLGNPLAGKDGPMLDYMLTTIVFAFIGALIVGVF